ncbi:MAG: carbohydrate ABC transporter permease [Oscillospiraceae bacterium]
MKTAKPARGTKIRATRSDIFMAVAAYGFVTAVALTMLYPVLNVIAVSMSSYRSYATTPWMFFPYELDFTAFRAVFGSSLLMRSYLNTVIITVSGTLLTLFFTVLTAYPLSRPNLKGKAFFMSLVVFTMMFNGGIIPNFLLIRGLGMYDKLIAQILPGVLSAFNVILMINFFKSLPESLLEAAKVDGASEPYILTRIVLPLSSAILATIALFAAVGYWNSYFSAVLYARRQAIWPVQLVLREIVMAANTAALNSAGNMAEMDLKSIPIDSLRYASLIVVMLPIMCIYPFLQKYFTKGVMLGAVKE